VGQDASCCEASERERERPRPPEAAGQRPAQVQRRRPVRRPAPTGGAATAGAAGTAGATTAGCGSLAGARGLGAGGGAAAAAAFAPARAGSTNDAVVSIRPSAFPFITTKAPIPTNRPNAMSAIAHDEAERPPTFVRAVIAVPGGSKRPSEYGACARAKCAGIDVDIATPGTLTEPGGTGAL
jgi:hypothetical protein